MRSIARKSNVDSSSSVFNAALNCSRYPSANSDVRATLSHISSHLFRVFNSSSSNTAHLPSTECCLRYHTRFVCMACLDSAWRLSVSIMAAIASLLSCTSVVQSRQDWTHAWISSTVFWALAYRSVRSLRVSLFNIFLFPSVEFDPKFSMIASSAFLRTTISFAIFRICPSFCSATFSVCAVTYGYTCNTAVGGVNDIESGYRITGCLFAYPRRVLCIDHTPHVVLDSAKDVVLGIGSIDFDEQSIETRKPGSQSLDMLLIVRPFRFDALRQILDNLDTISQREHLIALRPPYRSCRRSGRSLYPDGWIFRARWLSLRECPHRLRTGEKRRPVQTCIFDEDPVRIRIQEERVSTLRLPSPLLLRNPVP